MVATIFDSENDDVGGVIVMGPAHPLPRGTFQSGNKTPIDTIATARQMGRLCADGSTNSNFTSNERPRANRAAHLAQTHKKCPDPV